MLVALNRLVDAVEEAAGGEVDVAAVAAEHGTTEHHLRRMFSSLAGLPVSEYVRRRRMSLAAADVATSSDDLLTVAVRYGYGSTEAFGRAFRAVHGVGLSDARRNGGPFRSQQQLRFRLTVEGSQPMHVRICDEPAFRLVGHATRVPLIHEGVNPHIQAHIASIPMAEHLRLKGLSNASPTGLLQISDELDPDAAEGSELTYMHGVAVTSDTSDSRRLGQHRRNCRDLGSVHHAGTPPAGVAGDLGGDRRRVVPLEPVAAATRAVDRGHHRAQRGLHHRTVRALAAHRTRLTQRGPTRRLVYGPGALDPASE